jgi:hypothetical protein
MVFLVLYARTPFARVIRLPRTLGQEWLLLRCRSSPPSRGRLASTREPAPHGEPAPSCERR